MTRKGFRQGKFIIAPTRHHDHQALFWRTPVLSLLMGFFPRDTLAPWQLFSETQWALLLAQRRTFQKMGASDGLSSCSLHGGGGDRRVLAGVWTNVKIARGAESGGWAKWIKSLKWIQWSRVFLTMIKSHVCTDTFSHSTSLLIPWSSRWVLGGPGSRIFSLLSKLCM